MKKASLVLVGAALALAPLPTTATASLIWQETFSPDPSGVTFVDTKPASAPLELPVTVASMSVSGGTFDPSYVRNPGWGFVDAYSFAWWEPTDGGYTLVWDEEPGFGKDSIVTQPTDSIFTYWPTQFNNCYQPGAQASSEICEIVFDGGGVSVLGVVVDATTDFTLTFAVIPEPSAWMMLTIGFAGLGLVKLWGAPHCARSLDGGGRPDRTHAYFPSYPGFALSTFAWGFFGRPRLPGLRSRPVSAAARSRNGWAETREEKSFPISEIYGKVLRIGNLVTNAMAKWLGEIGRTSSPRCPLPTLRGENRA